MNINSIRAEARMRKIGEIIATINQCFKTKKDCDFEKMVNQICYTQRVARRTAIEYINVALSQIDHVIIDDNGDKLICPMPTTSKD